MPAKFLYVSTDSLAERLIKFGLTLIKYDKENGLYIFDNNQALLMSFSLEDNKNNIVESDVLTF